MRCTACWTVGMSVRPWRRSRATRVKPSVDGVGPGERRREDHVVDPSDVVLEHFVGRDAHAGDTEGLQM